MSKKKNPGQSPTNELNVAICRFSTVYGGVESYALTLAKELKARGVNVFLIVRNNILAEKGRNFGIKTFLITKKSKFDISFIFRVRKLLKQLNLDIVHTNGLLSDLMVGIIRIFMPLSFSHIVTVHTLPDADFSLNKKKLAFYKFSNNLSWRGAKKLIAVSMARKNDLINIGFKDDHIKVIHNGIEVPDIQKKTALDKTITIAAIGRLVPEKGMEYFIKAIPVVVKKCNSNIKFIIIGDGPCDKELKKLVKELDIEDFIEFAGFTENIWAALLNIDILVMPSLTEGLPMVLLEAGVCGIPAIASNVGGIPEFIKHEENGMLVSPKSSDDIALNILKIIYNPDLYKSLSKNAVDTVLSKGFNSKVMADSVLEVYDT